MKCSACGQDGKVHTDASCIDRLRAEVSALQNKVEILLGMNQQIAAGNADHIAENAKLREARDKQPGCEHREALQDAYRELHIWIDRWCQVVTPEAVDRIREIAKALGRY